MTKDHLNIEQVFRDRLDNRSAMPMDEFVDLALYDDSLGYYSKNKEKELEWETYVA